MEGAFEEVEARFAAVHDNFDDVETEDDVLAVEHAEPGAGAAADERFLLEGDGFGGACEFVAGARFYFDEGEDVLVAIAADEIDFAAVFRAEVSVENLVSAAAEEAGGETFAYAAEAMAGIFRCFRAPDRIQDALR